MKPLLFLSLLLVSHISMALTIVGDDAYPPYSFKEAGKVTGIYSDIINKALIIMKDNSKLTAMPWKRGLSGLKLKTLDALYPPYYRPEQRPYMSYSTDILDETLVIVCNKKIADKLDHFPASYQGISLGQNAGFASGKVVDDAVKSNIIKIYEAKGMAANLKKLIKKRVDCYVNDRLSILYELKKMEGKGEYDGKSIVETHILGVEKGYLAVNKESSSKIKSFLQDFNKTIEVMKESGEIKQIISKYTQ